MMRATIDYRERGCVACDRAAPATAQVDRNSRSTLRATSRTARASNSQEDGPGVSAWRASAPRRGADRRSYYDQRASMGRRSFHRALAAPARAARGLADARSEEDT